MKLVIILSLLLPFVFAQEVKMGCVAEEIKDYNMSFRVGGLFLILGTSAIGVFTPIVMHKVSPYSKGSSRDWILTMGKFFGTGVILGTAFVHILPAALANFNSPCLSEGWKSYGAFAGVFAMISSFALQLLEIAAVENVERIRARKVREKIDEVDLEQNTKESIHTDTTATLYNDHAHVHSAGLLEDGDAFKHIGTLILELGIVMHSIIVGVTLSNTSSEQFMTLLIALIFHQFFEGVALGTRIDEMKFEGWKRPIIMGLLFCIMTPIGCAIGIGIHSSFNNNLDLSSSILASAILDSLSAGILLYNSYISLMSNEMNQNPEFRQATLVRKCVCFISMYLGAGMMALIGKWA